MKKHMKKFVSILAVLACVFTLTACGETEANTVEGTAISDASMETYIIEYGESWVVAIDTYVRAGYTSADTDDEVFGEALDDYANSLEDIGEISGYDNLQAVIDDDGNYLVNIGIVGSDHSADIVITIDTTEGSLTSFATNVRYSFSELIGQAGLNTLLGMGTTFVVLVLLALLIYCFKFIGVFQEKQKRKAALKEQAQAPAASPAPVSTPAAATPVPEEPVYGEEVDDTELIAVIAAAIAAYEEEEAGVPADGFVVRKVRKSRRKF